MRRSFESTEGKSWNLGDRLVADPRPGVSRRPDGLTVNIQVCEHPNAAGEVRAVTRIRR